MKLFINPSIPDPNRKKKGNFNLKESRILITMNPGLMLKM